MSEDISTIETVQTSEDDPRENETRHEAFIRIAARRTNVLLGQLALLENMAKSSNYEYQREEIDRMFAAIDAAYTRVKMRFELNVTAKTPSQARGGFKF